jgi:UDP-2,3-diacylglucosamine pyrophosphatase LpxH
MTPFRFRLERVLGVRRTQFQVAESECRQAECRLRAIQAQQAALAARKSETRNSVVRLPIVAGRILEPLTYWFHWTETEAHRLIKLEQALTQELQKRRVALVEAHRKVRLLEKLHDNRQAEWQREFDREIEEIAADAINSRYVRNR